MSKWQKDEDYFVWGFAIFQMLAIFGLVAAVYSLLP